jgi:Flp pilus assembly protein TadD
LRNLRQLGKHVGRVGFVCLSLMVVGLFAQFRTTAGNQPTGQAQSPRELFIQGENALRAGQLQRAEAAFRQVVAIDPQSAGAYANLGVIYMRRKQWNQALRMFRKADHLAPQVAGIRLNIGLVYYRQNDFKNAIPPFESVVRDQPDSSQARYLLGLCYFFTDRWADAVDTLQPLWSQQYLNINYLYVLSIAANKAGRKDVDEKAVSQLTKIGGATPEFHLIMGRAYLNHEEDDKALAELDAAEKGEPKLPYLHYHKGMAYLHKQDFQHAAEQFKQEIALNPDVAFSYDKLASAYVALEKEDLAEQNYRKAVQLDPRLTSSYMGLAKIYQKQGKFAPALKALDSVQKLSPEDYTAHYLRGQILQRLGQSENAKVEFDTYTRMMNAAREKRGKELSGEIPSPDITAEPQ